MEKQTQEENKSLPTAAEILMKRFPYAPSLDWYKPIIECMEEYRNLPNEPSIDVFERVLRNEIHKNLFILDISVTNSPDLVIRGVDELVRVMLDYYKMYQPEPSIQEDGLEEAAKFYSVSRAQKGTIPEITENTFLMEHAFKAGAEYIKQLNK